MDPTLKANMDELEREYQRQVAHKEQLVKSAENTQNNTKLNEIAAATRSIDETLEKMAKLIADSGSDDQQDVLIRRIMEIQRDYNGLLVSTDKLETLRRIRQMTDMREGYQLKLYGLFFLLASIGLIITITRTSSPPTPLR